VDTTDQIFDEGAANEMFSSYNGLFLDLEIELALDKGCFVIILEPVIKPQCASFPKID
jgi:hypothetical protein